MSKQGLFYRLSKGRDTPGKEESIHHIRRLVHNGIIAARFLSHYDCGCDCQFCCLLSIFTSANISSYLKLKEKYMSSLIDTPISAPSLHWQYLLAVFVSQQILASCTSLSIIQATIFSAIALLDILGEKPASIRFIPKFLIIKLICVYVFICDMVFLEILPLLGYDPFSVFGSSYYPDIFVSVYRLQSIEETQFYYTAWMLAIGIYGLMSQMKNNLPILLFWSVYYPVAMFLTWMGGAYWESRLGILLKLAIYLMAAAAILIREKRLFPIKSA